LSGKLEKTGRGGGYGGAGEKLKEKNILFLVMTASEGGEASILTDHSRENQQGKQNTKKSGQVGKQLNDGMIGENGRKGEGCHQHSW